MIHVITSMKENDRKQISHENVNFKKLQEGLLPQGKGGDTYIHCWDVRLEGERGSSAGAQLGDKYSRLFLNLPRTLTRSGQGVAVCGQTLIFVPQPSIFAPCTVAFTELDLTVSV